MPEAAPGEPHAWVEVRARRAFDRAECGRKFYLRRHSECRPADGLLICGGCASKLPKPDRRFRCTRCHQVKPLVERAEDHYANVLDADHLRFYGRAAWSTVPVSMCAVCDARASRYVPVSPTNRPCEHCGALFTAKRSTARYCSGRCRVAAHRARA